MTTFLEIKERIKGFCSSFDIYLLAVVRAILMFIVVNTINSEIGFDSRFNSLTIAVLISLVTAFLPVNFILVVAALLILIHLYALALPVAIVAACFMLVIFLLYFRFSPKSGYLAALTPVANIIGMPYLMPFCAGLMDENPTSCISVVSGTFFYYFLKGVKANSVSLSTMGEDDTIISKINETVSQITDNREMIVMMVVMFAAVIVIWVLRRRSFDHAWVYAIASGAVIQLLGVIIGANIQNFSVNIPGLILGVAISTLIAFGLQFFFFNLDYDRTQRVQFEDDDYYYYVKAVPKMTVAMGKKDIKTYASTDDITRDDIVEELREDE